LIDLFGIYQAAIVSEQVSYDIARFAALADVTQSDAVAYIKQRDPLGSLSVETGNLICSASATSEIRKAVTFWPEIVSVKIQARAECEN
jgi:hypothetical protein